MVWWDDCDLFWVALITLFLSPLDTLPAAVNHCLTAYEKLIREGDGNNTIAKQAKHEITRQQSAEL